MKQKIAEKLREIHEDLEANVTRIYERRELIMLYDLAYHSVLQFQFMGHLITRGWVEVLVVGDTRCGKTKTAERLLRHYRCGEMGTGENTSLAGLLGGMQQISKQWSIVWGKYPRNDRRLIVIDEASNLPVHSIPDFATIRSEGVARITKIQTEQTHARTRAIWISNPRVDRDGRGRAISGYDFGILTVPELIGRQADVARFDVATVVSNGEVPEGVILAEQRKAIPHRVSSSLSHSLVLWAWSRRPEQVVLHRETEQEILRRASGLAKRYHDSIPLVKLEEIPEKLARLAVSLAARLFSTDDGVTLLVLPEHVEYVADFLDSVYCKPAVAYDEYSRRFYESETLTDQDKVVGRIGQYGSHFVSGLLSFDIIRQSTIEDLSGEDRDGARALLSLLVRSRCLKPEHTWYRKSQAFIRLLKGIEMGKIKVEERREEF